MINVELSLFEFLTIFRLVAGDKMDLISDFLNSHKREIEHRIKFYFSSRIRQKKYFKLGFLTKMEVICAGYWKTGSKSATAALKKLEKDL